MFATLNFFLGEIMKKRNWFLTLLLGALSTLIVPAVQGGETGYTIDKDGSFGIIHVCPSSLSFVLGQRCFSIE